MSTIKYIIAAGIGFFPGPVKLAFFYALTELAGDGVVLVEVEKDLILVHDDTPPLPIEFHLLPTKNDMLNPVLEEVPLEPLIGKASFLVLPLGKVRNVRTVPHLQALIT